jgi:hypothetical protein
MGFAFSHSSEKVASHTSCPALLSWTSAATSKLARDGVVQFVDPTTNTASTQAALACSAPDMLQRREPVHLSVNRSQSTTTAHPHLNAAPLQGEEVTPLTRNTVSLASTMAAR